MSESKNDDVISPGGSELITRIEVIPYISRDLADFGVPGVWVEVDPETAEQMGAFEETAVTFADTEDEDGD